MDDDFADELDDIQDSLFPAAEWNWVYWASSQLDSIGDLFDTVGKMFHDTTLQMRWHYRFKQERKHMVTDALQEIEQLTGE